MSFRNNQVNPTFDVGDCSDCAGDCHDNKCVCRILRKIAEVQAEVDGDGKDCEYGCKSSIDSLVNPAQNIVENDTIPFALYCKGSCEPFIGQSVVQAMVGGNRVFQCYQSPLFRVNKVKDDCCAEIELLLPITEGGSTPGDCHELCDFFPGNSIRDLQRTGICLTVDLCDFMSVACLEPVQTLPVSEFRASLREQTHHK